MLPQQIGKKQKTKKLLDWRTILNDSAKQVYCERSPKVKDVSRLDFNPMPQDKVQSRIDYFFLPYNYDQNCSKYEPFKYEWDGHHRGCKHRITWNQLTNLVFNEKEEDKKKAVQKLFINLSDYREKQIYGINKDKMAEPEEKDVEIKKSSRLTNFSSVNTKKMKNNDVTKKQSEFLDVSRRASHLQIYQQTPRKSHRKIKEEATPTFKMSDNG